MAQTSFRFGLGHVTLDFLATRERLPLPDDLSRWLTEAGLAASPHLTGRFLAQAQELRDAIDGVLASARGHTEPPAASLRLLNAWARRPLTAPQISKSYDRVVVGPDTATAALAHIARQSVELVTGPELALVRDCAGCSLRFIDRSRPGKRRWCSMEHCGNRDKTARYRRRQRS